MILRIWKKACHIGWPVVVNHIFSTAMRTTDMLLMGLFSPAAIAAVGLGDVWERIVLRIGRGLGVGSIALIAQETGRGGKDSDTILTQSLLTGMVLGVPFVFMGFMIPEVMIRILGAKGEVIVLAAKYLTCLFSAAPFRIMTIISARALQGTGNTRAPMVISITGNLINILLSIILALGIGPIPTLGVIGIGLGTFIAKLFESGMYCFLFIMPQTRLKLGFHFTRWNYKITRRILKIGIPVTLKGGYESLIDFPFNSLLLIFGTEAAAAYHISRRIQQQLMAPLLRSFSTVTIIMTGHEIGAGKIELTRNIGKSMIMLSLIVIGSLTIVLWFTAPTLISLFTRDFFTHKYSIGFLRVFIIGAPLLGLYNVISGLLAAAGDTKTPFYGLVMSHTLCKLGLSCLLSVVFGFHLIGIYIGLISDRCFRFFWVLRRFKSEKWVDKVI